MVDFFQDMRSEMVMLLEQMGVPVEVHHHEVAGASAPVSGITRASLGGEKAQVEGYHRARKSGGGEVII